MTGHAVFSPSTYLERCDVILGLGGGNLTIEMWVQLSDAAALTATLFSYFASDHLDYWLSFSSGRLWHYASTPHDGDRDIHSGHFILSDGGWHHVAFTAEASGDSCTYSFFKDGVIVGSPETSPDHCLTFPDRGCALLGQYRHGAECRQESYGFFDAYEFQGNLTEVRLWRTARTEAEIRKGLSRRINASEAAREPGLVALWPLDCTYELDDIKGLQHLGSCDSAFPDKDRYSLAHIVDMECPCPDESYCVRCTDVQGQDTPANITSATAQLQIIFRSYPFLAAR